MSNYEARAWEKLIAHEQSRRGSVRTRVTEKLSGALTGAASSIDGHFRKLPGGDKIASGVDAAIRASLSGAANAIFIPAISSVSIDSRASRLRKRYPEVGDASPFFILDLQELDKGRPRQKIAILGATASAGASVAITGAEVSTTVSGGATAAVVAAAIAGDVAASLALLGRATAEVAVHYGFDPNEPGEEIFLMGVLSYSTAASVEGKVGALTALSKLSQQMMRRATWKELEKDVLVKVIQAVFTKIGIRLTHKRLAQVVPVVGGVVSAGLSYDMLSRAVRDASHVYRARYLAQKHGLSFDDWVSHAASAQKISPGLQHELDEAPVDVEAEVDEAIKASLDDESGNDVGS
ncbi:MAG: hypothetical protein CMF56_03580 [Leifsonia sp.]|mgnify:CR=1 FL=1|nr:hypothetical protein [Leifsonia sp.]|tara:strand:- start:21275 stop:22327 length:1053 start_codon:yes stop_codon:yes gene_type:complete